MTKNRSTVQLVWGVMLVVAGIGVFFRIPQVMPRIEKIGQFSSILFFVRFSFYLLGVLLIAGGSKKVFNHYQKPGDPDSDR